MAHHELMGGKLHLYKRDNSRFWQCSNFLGSRNHRASTKEEGLAQAKDFAEDWYLELKGKHKRGEIKGGKSFRHAAETFRREYEVITEGQRNPQYVKDHGRRLDIYLLQFFGDKSVLEITPGMVQVYRIERHEKTVAKRGKPPAHQTIHQEIGTLRQVLKTAYRHGWLPYLPDLSEPYKRSRKISHRELFNTILDELDLKTDREGTPRTAYSLRHTYICFRLMEGADIYQIAKNCRTSVEMIEKYYASHVKNSLNAAAVNVRRAKPRKGKAEAQVDFADAE